MSISTLLNQIDKGEIVLPAIQREFVWPKEKIFMLLDSIMRGYPLGIVLMWETYDDLRFRQFIKHYRADIRPSFEDNTTNRELLVVLDGQQRLQSLYIALYGIHEKHSLYFDVLSGKASDDLREIAYAFDFETPVEIAKYNNEMLEKLNDQNKEQKENGQAEWWICFQDLFRMSNAGKMKLRHKLIKDLALSTEDALRLELNLSRIDEVMTKEENILKTSVIDENKPLDSGERKSEADVLEVFVRVNRQGTPLNRSDLIFSMLKLDWKESAETLPDFVASINEGNSFEFNADFVIRCLFAVSDMGSKLDINKLRNKNNIIKFKANFARCCDAIRALVDVVQKDCWVSSSRAFGGQNTFVPFVYYLYHVPKHQIPTSELKSFRQALFLIGFTKMFSRYADSRIGKVIGWEMAPRLKEGNYEFPIERIVRWSTQYWFWAEKVQANLLQNNVFLTHCLVQGKTGAKAKLLSSSLEMDHIFPRSKLRKKGFEPPEYNHFANFWLLAKGKNQNKSAKDPKKFFIDVNNQDLRRAYIDRDMLIYSKFRKFINARGKVLIEHVRKTLGFKKDSFI